MSATSDPRVEVIWEAFQALEPKQKDQFMERLVADAEVLEDLGDILEAHRRRDELSRPLEEVAKEL